MLSPALMADCRALTLHQPWAHAITNYGKRVENRSWPPPESTDVILIHAGCSWDWAARDTFARLGLRGPTPGHRSTGVIVAVARLAHVCGAGPTRAQFCSCGPWAVPGQYHWRLADEVHVLGKPVPARGRQRLWRPDPATLHAVARELELDTAPEVTFGG